MTRILCLGALAALLAASPLTGAAQAQTTTTAPKAETAPAASPAPTSPPPASPKTETFGRWSTIIDEVNTGEDVRRTCAASTAFLDQNGTGGTLTLAISNGDALPPDGYPSLVIALRNKDLPAGENIPAVFGDDKGKVKATVSADIGDQWMLDNKKEVALALLRAMRRAAAIDVVFANKPVASISMDGFTKAYRSLGASCGFATNDVAP
ncbi:MAG: hypothetical protein EOS58_23815 [Mesorhizobium sp.]|uniref:hypothetical protein n=1 Tax=unclassified Mesorhizobium TaxID=325217 RepID=UPI000F74C1DE|nr:MULTISPECIES: hypothetical protein [unclassified Mesorhizobium]AZO47479.1 hypothetical protein EJ073_06215 [Mesorhizobium sp. M4B.F.Ca.ET.058.02.1.1]RVC45488.1 hypothetical protein EN781_09645 [Mesorhizobium sp. M4A.F.Ca.ET.090.04.2.1]RWC54415.1 MAG: hypothetical protein EOS54_10390 [Mesorhizobium sp.]RWD01857.1 MAG: hypothetical protein EOS58_23815 [Mesorhizobium sp.]RWD13341.1 MAG: hypothetical protein EOS74_21435 [Mesorhizobium sp.]